MSKKSRISGIQKAVEFAGGVRPLARLTNLSKSYIWKMLQAGKVPAEQCHLLKEKTGVPLHELNPVIYRDAA